MKLRARTLLATTTLLSASIAGCARGSAPPPSNAARPALSPAPRQPSPLACARGAASPAFVPLGESARQSSTVALARFGDRTVAFIADEDARALTLVDVDSKSELASTPLGGSPSHLLLTRDGRVLVALRDDDALLAFEPTTPTAKLRRLCSIPTSPEPLALAVSPDETTLFVSSGWGHALSGYDMGTLARRFDIDLPREPRAVVISDDGKTAFVTHAVGGRVSAVDLERAHHPVQSIGMHHGGREDTGSLADRHTSCQGYALARAVVPAGRLFAPQVLVDPGNLEEPASGYGDGNGPAEQAGIAVIDQLRASPLQSSLDPAAEEPPSGSNEALPACLLPRAAVVDGQSKTLLVACVGLDTVIAYDALSASPIRSEIRRYAVGSGPTGLAVDGEKARVVAWSQFDRSLHVLPLNADDPSEPISSPPLQGARLALAPLDLSGLDYQRIVGRHLFHTGPDPRISSDGRACASCHPDGRDDAITWATPDGPRRTVMLAGRIADTAPYGWNGAGRDLREHLGHTFERLKGRGLSSLELEALLAYVKGLRAPAGRADDSRVARGKALFHSAETACATCHRDGTGTDGRAHDVGSKTPTDRSAAFDTPSLKAIAGHAPYFHDGRYSTLRELLRDNPRMGKTKHLDDADLDALEAYLRSL
jgi:mono/diheme cytochrome c family protein